MADPKSIYILHGWTKDTSKWQPLLKHIEKSGFRPKLLKIPGLTSKINKPWKLQDYVDWFEEQIPKGEKILVIAHSFGGRIAIRFDVKNPNVIKKLVLIDSAGIRPASIPAVVKRASFKAIAKLGKKITQSKGARNLLYKFAREQDYLKADKKLAQTMTNVIEEDLRKDLPFVKAHTLIVWGSKDKTTPLSDGRLMNKTITGSSLKIIDGAGHSPQYSHHQEVAKYIKDFLGASK